MKNLVGKTSGSLTSFSTVIVTIAQIVSNLRSGLSECGEATEMSTPMKEDSIKLWKNRTVRVMYSLTAVAASLKVSQIEEAEWPTTDFNGTLSF